ncbi:MAG TPA: hypothetical protein VFC23_08940, partial [Thermoanaerobaculia bacterium]|nr:hypothetical protein [Thermoanaerobaculia bacterium]
MLRQTLTLSLLLALLCACHKNPQATEAPTATPANEAAAPSQPAGDASSPAPISAHGGTVADSQPAQPAAGAPAGSIDFDLPTSWEKQSP